MAPAWFESETYFNNKLTQWQQEDPEAGRTADDLLAALEDAGYVGEDGLYRHFVDYGNAENISPNAYFDAEYYFQSKAANYYDVAFGAVTSAQIASMKTAFEKAGLSAWDHYIQYGAAEGINPSEAFDTNEYLDAKLALTGDDFEGTRDDLCKALAAAGLNPIMHYELYGEGEGIVIGPEPEPGPEPGPGPAPVPGDATYTNGKLDYTTQYVWADDRGEIAAETTDTRFVTLENQLTSQQVFKGSDGHDMLDITLGASSTEGNIVAPLSTGVEDVRIKALQHNTVNNGDNLPGINNEAQIDAGDIEGMTRLWSSNSRADVVVEDVRTDSNKMTEVFQSADPGDVDFEVYFDPQHLTSEAAASNGVLQIELMDVYSGDLDNKPLEQNTYDTFSFYFTPDGGSAGLVTLNVTGSDGKAVNGNATYNDLLSAFQKAIAAQGLSGAITAELGDDFADKVFLGGTLYECDLGKYIVLKSTAGTIAVKDDNGTQLPGTGWKSTGDLPVDGGIVWTASNTSGGTCPLIVTNIWLDNVARVNWDLGPSECLPDDIIYGSQSGEMIVGSMAGRGGVERFNVTVDRSSWLSSLSSTNEALRMVKVVNGDVIDDEDGNNASDNGIGNLFIGESLIDNASYVELLDWAAPAKFLTTDGLVDVAIFDAETFVGDINLGASITEASYDKYLKGVDGSHTMDKWAPLTGYGNFFSYLLGAGDDTLNMEVDGSIANDSDFGLVIEGNDGDDQFLFTFDFDSAVLYDLRDNDGATYRYEENATAITNEIANQLVKFDPEQYIAIADLANVLIDGGAGNDIVHLNGWGSVLVDGGEGRDVIYNEDYTGGEAGLWNDNVLARGVWLVNAYADDPRGTHDYSADARAIFVDYVDGAQPLDNSALSTYDEVNDIAAGGYGEVRVKVTYQGVTSVKSITASELDTAQVNLKDGVINFLNDSDLNALIIKAINDDSNDNMNHLLQAKDGAGYSLIIESLIGGDNKAPVITFEGRENSKADWTSLKFDNVADYKAELATVDGEDITLVNGEAISNNIINGGAGDDLIVLGTNTTTTESIESNLVGSHDIVAFDKGFGKDIVLNFVAESGWLAGDGEDLLDFTAFFAEKSSFNGFTGNDGEIKSALGANTVAFVHYAKAEDIAKVKGFANSVLLTDTGAKDINGVSGEYDVYSCDTKDGKYEYQGTIALIDENGKPIDTDSITNVDVVVDYYA